MARRDKLACVHEPFGDAFYYGPERIGERFENDADGREKSGFAETTYADVLSQIEEAGKEGGKRIFVKDMAQYLIPPNGGKAAIVPSAVDVPPSAPAPDYLFPVPPLDKMTGFYNFMPSEAGYAELRTLFDFLVKERIVDESNLLVVDADDLLDDPEAIIRAYCQHVGLDFTDNMLNWGEEDTKIAQEKFAKWTGFHEDALGSTSLRPRNKAHKKVITRESEEAEWKQKFGDKGLKEIRECVDANVKDYEYLKKFAIRV
uniref:Uncharacterized protein n=1 Tax=Colletotrichum fructicola (strain Nara gc5) TaxID=1213859 RepID=L2GAV1_COLFN